VSGGPADISHFTFCYDNRERGRVKIVKRTLPTGSAQHFSFHPSAGLAPDDFQLADGEYVELSPKPGTHTVEEAATPGWKVHDITCDDTDSAGWNRTARIAVDPGEVITCTFYNVKEDAPPPPVISPGGPPPALPPQAVPVPPTPLAPAAKPSAGAVGATTARSATASLRRLSSCASRRVRIAVTGSPIRRIVFSVNGRRVRTVVAPPRRRSFSVTLPVGRGGETLVTARVTFANGARSRTLRTALARCAPQQVWPQFTG
jgi:hypothetical protein